MLTVDVPNVDLDDEAFIVMITVDVPSVDLDGEAFVVMCIDHSKYPEGGDNFGYNNRNYIIQYK
jgi:hypothetical protein